MKIACTHCSTSYDIPEERIRKMGGHVVFPCPACKKNIEVKVSGAAPQQQSTPQQAPPQQQLTGTKLKARILRRVKDLPPMPQVAQKARQIMSQEGSSFKDLAKVIETDQAIATRVLKIANSPFYGVRGNVTSIQHASVVLGMKTLNELLTLACASSVLGSALDGYGLDSGELWRHSLAVASCARMIALQKNPELVDNAFSAGLIHDCGKLILDPYIFERKGDFETFVQDSKKSFLSAEKNILGFDHAEIAADVCEQWQIPKELINPIRYHHKPSNLHGNELGYIVHAADSISLMSGIGVGEDGIMYEIDQEAMEALDLDSTSISLFMADTVEYVEKTISGF